MRTDAIPPPVHEAHKRVERRLLLEALGHELVGLLKVERTPHDRGHRNVDELTLQDQTENVVHHVAKHLIRSRQYTHPTSQAAHVAEHSTNEFTWAKVNF